MSREGLSSRIDLTDSKVRSEVSSEGELGGGTATRGFLVLGMRGGYEGGEHGGSSANKVLVL